MYLEKAEAGLTIVASGSGQYDRQNIQTVEPTQSYVGASVPVTYSFTIANYPGTNNTGFQTHLFLVPGQALTDGTPDWNQPNVIFLDLQNNDAGGGSATFQYDEQCRKKYDDLQFKPRQWRRRNSRKHRK
jgi:hypothetical protein